MVFVLLMRYSQSSILLRIEHVQIWKRDKTTIGKFIKSYDLMLMILSLSILSIEEKLRNLSKRLLKVLGILMLDML